LRLDCNEDPPAAAARAGKITSANVLLGDNRGGGKGPRQIFLQGGREGFTGTVRDVADTDAGVRRGEAGLRDGQGVEQDADFPRTTGREKSEDPMSINPWPAGAAEMGTAWTQVGCDGVAKMPAVPRSLQPSSESDSQNLPRRASIGIEEPTSNKSRSNVKHRQSGNLEFAGFTSFADARRRALRTAGATATPDGMRPSAHWSPQP
jgi:hypothetical protein